MASHTVPPVTAFPPARGFTLVELMVTLAVALILTMMVVPSVQGLLERQRLSAAVEAVQAQVVLAKSEAAKRSREVVLNVRAGTPWDATLAYFDQVSTSTVSRAITGDSYPGVVMASTVGGGTFRFEPLRGTATAGWIRLSSASSNHQVDIGLDVVGRMTVCSPNYGRYPACP